MQLTPTTQILLKVLLLYKYDAIFPSIAHEIFPCVPDLSVMKYKLLHHALLVAWQLPVVAPSQHSLPKAVHVSDEEKFSMLHKLTVDRALLNSQEMKECSLYLHIIMLQSA
jgi:hypothetical protein